MQGCCGRELVIFIVVYVFILDMIGYDMEYRINEELLLNYIIGNIVDDLKFLERNYLINVDCENICFNIFFQGNFLVVYFNINDRIGLFFINGIIDREFFLYCKFLNICEIKLDVSVQLIIGMFFEIIKVKVIVLDINDNMLYFVKSKMNLEILELFILNFLFFVEGVVDLDSGNNIIQIYLLKLVGFFFFLSYDNFLIGSFVLKFILNRILD